MTYWSKSSILGIKTKKLALDCYIDSQSENIIGYGQDIFFFKLIYVSEENNLAF